MCDAEFSGASIPHVAAVFVVGRVALVDEVALPVSTAGRDMGQPTYIDVDQFVTTNGLAVNTLRPLVSSNLRPVDALESAWPSMSPSEPPTDSEIVPTSGAGFQLPERAMPLLEVGERRLRTSRNDFNWTILSTTIHAAHAVNFKLHQSPSITSFCQKRTPLCGLMASVAFAERSHIFPNLQHP